MLSAEEIYEVARKFVFDEKLTSKEEQQREEIIKNRDYYIQYCAGVALLDMMERKGEYEPRYTVRQDKEEVKQQQMIQKTTGDQI